MPRSLGILVSKALQKLVNADMKAFLKKLEGGLRDREERRGRRGVLRGMMVPRLESGGDGGCFEVTEGLSWVYGVWNG